MPNQFEEVRFLIVDDDEVSVMSIQRAIKKQKLVNPQRVARDGQEALEILREETSASNVLPPYIIILDLNMPRMNGIEFLEVVRNDTTLHRAIIFVLTTSEAPSDIASAYDKNIAGYIVKESASETFADALAMIESYSKLVVLPT